jgi:hypothetical protein
LLKARWDYKQAGIMDWTHLRFFTRATMLDLITTAGFELETIKPELWGPKSEMLDKFSLGLLQEFLAYAYNFSAIKPFALV